MGRVPITVTVDEEVLEEFKKVCEKNDIKISTKINSLMKEWAMNNKNEWDNIMEGKYIEMKEITQKDYEEFIKKYKEIVIEDTKITIGEKKKIKKLQPEKFELQTTSVWSFPKRGNWATHKGDYRGNWAPEIPRNIILRYSKEGDLILDQMVGGGTTLIECKLTGRNGIGVDLNKEAIMLTRDR